MIPSLKIHPCKQFLPFRDDSSAENSSPQKCSAILRYISNWKNLPEFPLLARINFRVSPQQLQNLPQQLRSLTRNSSGKFISALSIMCYHSFMNFCSFSIIFDYSVFSFYHGGKQNEKIMYRTRKRSSLYFYDCPGSCDGGRK